MIIFAAVQKPESQAGLLNVGEGQKFTALSSRLLFEPF